jgi:segregation and condensation protein B
MSDPAPPQEMTTAPPEPPETPETPECPQVPESPELESADSAATPDAADSAEAAQAANASAGVAPAEAPQKLTATELALRIEAVLMTTDRALPLARLNELLGEPGAKAIQQAVAALNQVYEQTQRSFRIEQLAGGWQILTLPQYAEVLTALHKARSSTKLGPAAMETLAIIAYKQPILRAQVESIRGVACGEVIRALMERRLVKIVGRAEEVGRPMLYGTTRTFLEVFGLSNLKDLPRVEELKFKEVSA